MTRVRGVRVCIVPCCGAHYAFPRYLSMNFSAFEYWTDGWREMSPMPNDEGLRRCQCGRFLLLRDLVEVAEAEASDLPTLKRVAPVDLQHCLAQPADEDLELAARLELWRHLNHEYRERYRQHRDAEDAQTRARWQASHPDARSWWQRLRGHAAVPYGRQACSPFTVPPFEPGQAQRENLARLAELLARRRVAGEVSQTIEMAEVLRELGRFDAASEVMAGFDAEDDQVTVRLMHQLIRKRTTAPMRFRL